VGDVKIFEFSFIDSNTPKIQNSTCFEDVITVNDQVQQTNDGDLQTSRSWCYFGGRSFFHRMLPRWVVLDGPAGKSRHVENSGSDRKKPVRLSAAAEDSPR
jgi:hypothetical protein